MHVKNNEDKIDIYHHLRVLLTEIDQKLIRIPFMLYFSNFCPICLIVNTLLSMHMLMTSMYHTLLVGHFAIVLVLQSIPICLWKHSTESLKVFI